MNPLKSVMGTIVAGFVLAIVILLAIGDNHIPAAMPVNAIIIWLHVFAGIIWIGLLYYFNFVQVPALADAASDDGGPGDSPHKSWHRCLLLRTFERVERSYGSFRRTFQLPSNVDAGAVQASFSDGVLTIELPKKEEAA